MSTSNEKDHQQDFSIQTTSKLIVSNLLGFKQENLTQIEMQQSTQKC